jgi:hemerythrin
MAIIHWKEEYSINIPKIDEQHKKLVGYINQLYDAMLIGNGEEAVAEIIEGLIIYTVHHFRTEEQIMFSNGYSDYLVHKAQHEELEKQVLAFKEKLRDQNPRIITELAGFLKNWLINHIAASDKILGRYLNEKGFIKS